MIVKKPLITALIYLLASSFSHAGSYQDLKNVDNRIKSAPLKYSLGIRYGAPTTKQVLTINTKEFYFQRRLRSPDNLLLLPALELSISQLNVGENKGYIYGFGPAISIPIGGTKDRLSFTAQGKIHYLTRHDFGRKRYGGPIQWTYAFGIKTDLTINTFMSYSWMHMSNADAYEYNPALEIHRVTLGIKF